jgi:hypothetical protein
VEAAFASFEASVEVGVTLAVLSPAEAGAAVAAEGSEGETVADSTLAVILGEPAELGVVLVAAALAGAGATFAPASVDAAVFSTIGVAAAVVSPLAVAEISGCTGATLMLIELGAAPDTGAGEVGTVFTANSEFGFAAAEAALTVVVCAVGTLPAPGVPMPGKTVPCCRLPVFGRAAEGVADAFAVVCVGAAACFSGKLIGGNLGGTGIGACAVVVVSVAGACGLRRNTPIKGALAAGAGPAWRTTTSAFSEGCTRSVMLLPSLLRV